MTKPRILVTGCRGMLGAELLRKLGAAGRVEGVDIETGDLSDPSFCNDLLGSHAPQIVVNAAAYTLVDEVEKPEVYPTAFAANATVPGNLARYCAENGALLIHFSTDYVYDGSKSGPYVESDSPSPISAYGRTKLAGDEAIYASGCRYLILRTAWLFGNRGHNFIEAILKKAREAGRLAVVDDQLGSPTYAVDLAEAVRVGIEKEIAGLYLFANGGQTTWHGYAEKICRLAGLEAPIERIETSTLGLPAPRPKNSSLDAKAFIRKSGFEPRTWSEALADYLEKRKSIPSRT
jgi:dTDP-4-dehydrorhamnose reductase